MSYLDVLLAARAADKRKAQLRRSVRQRHIAPAPIVMVPFQPGGEAHTLAAIGWGDDPKQLHELVVCQPLNRQQLFDALAPLVNWFTPRFEAAWRRGEQDPAIGRRVVDPDLLPQIITPNPAAADALGRLGRRLAYLPTDASDDPDAPPPASEELVRFGRQLRWLAGHAVASGQSLLLDPVTLLGYHWVTVQSISERAHLGALDAWIDPRRADPDDAADTAERLSIGPYAVPTQEHPIADIVQAWGAADRAGEPTHDLTTQLSEGWHQIIAPVWECCWRSLDRIKAIAPDTRYLPQRRKADAEAYARQMAWLDGPTGGRVRTRQTPRQAIWSKKMAEYDHAVLEAQERVTDPLAMVDEVLAGKAVNGTIVAVDLNNREIRPGNRNATSVPIITLRSPRKCLIPIGREVWWADDCGRVAAVMSAAVSESDGSSTVTLKLSKGSREGGPALKAVAARRGRTCFSVYTTAQFFPGKLPVDDPFTHTNPDQVLGHLEDPGDAA